MFIVDQRKVGLPSLVLDAKQQEAILTEMGWDGEELTEEGASIPGMLLREWFDKKIAEAIQSAVDQFESELLTNTV